MDKFDASKDPRLGKPVQISDVKYNTIQFRVDRSMVNGDMDALVGLTRELKQYLETTTSFEQNQLLTIIQKYVFRCMDIVILPDGGVIEPMVIIVRALDGKMLLHIRVLEFELTDEKIKELKDKQAGTDSVILKV
jgi:hypothetical protein